MAIVGEPATAADALQRADDAYLFAVVTALASGGVALLLRRQPAGAAVAVAPAT